MGSNAVNSNASDIYAPFRDGWWKIDETSAEHRAFEKRASLLKSIGDDIELEMTEETPSNQRKHDAIVRTNRELGRRQPWWVHRKRKAQAKRSKLGTSIAIANNYRLESWIVDVDEESGRYGVDGNSGRHDTRLRGKTIKVTDRRDLLKLPDGRVMVWYKPLEAWVLTKDTKEMIRERERKEGWEVLDQLADDAWSRGGTFCVGPQLMRLEEQRRSGEITARGKQQSETKFYI